MPLQTYVVKRKEVTLQRVRVEATSVDQARAMAKNGQGVLCRRQPPPHYYVVDVDDWDVEEEG